MNKPESTRHTAASDFDQTLSFNDSGTVLADLLGVTGFEEKVNGLRRSNLSIRAGARVPDSAPTEFRGVRRENLVEAGRRVRLKNHISQLVEFLKRGIEGSRFRSTSFGGAPRGHRVGARGHRPPDHIYGTEFDYDPSTEEVRAVRQVPAGYGKVEVLEEIERHWTSAPIGRSTSATAAPMCT